MTTIASIEPMHPDTDRALEDLAVELVAAASGFVARLNPVLRQSLGKLVRSMNCYYSNLIEGHNTHPVDIDRALAGDYSNEPEKRNLQLEARAHIEVQRIIDEGSMPAPIVSVETIQWIHEAFCSRLPDAMLSIANSETGRVVEMRPGELRTMDVRVGRHIAPEPEMVAPLLARFVEAYSARMLSRLQNITDVGASHHRLLWIHPFIDGNGRVSRLFSHALLKQLGIGSELWSVSRGLARNVSVYKRLLAEADETRRGDLDGRGNLTLSGLTAFARFFLETCLDQVRFMEDLMRPQDFLRRIELWTTEQVAAGQLPKGSWPLLREAALIGEFSRSQATALTGYRERQARTVLSSLIEKGLLVSASPKGNVRLGFPTDVIEHWLPRLYPAM